MASDRKQLAEHCRRATLDALVALGGTAHRREIRERALRDGGFSAEELALPGPPSRPRVPRMVDHCLEWSLTELRRHGIVRADGGGVWSVVEGHVATFGGPPQDAEALREWRSRYAEYLRTEHWQRRRERALAEAGHRCQLDQSHEGLLDVHHNSYERLGREIPSDLVVLCRECHRRHHGHQRGDKRRRTQPAAKPPAPATKPLVVDVAARHEELMRRSRRRRWPWSRG